MFKLNIAQQMVLVCGCWCLVGLIAGYACGYYEYKYLPEKRRLERKRRKEDESNE